MQDKEDGRFIWTCHFGPRGWRVPGSTRGSRVLAAISSHAQTETLTLPYHSHPTSTRIASSLEQDAFDSNMIVSSTGGTVERFRGDQLPTRWDWYSSSEGRGAFAWPLLSPSFEHPTPPDETDTSYTHSLLFAFHSGDGEQKLLLAEKLRGFGKGTFNGVGGKLLPAETARQSVIRETEEETGLKLGDEDVVFAGSIRINVECSESIQIATFVTHLTAEQEQQVESSDEVRTKWYSAPNGGLDLSTLPLSQLRPEHTAYLSPLLRYHLTCESKMVFDLHMRFHPELGKDELPAGERPENHRTVCEWVLLLQHPAKPDHPYEEERDIDSASECSYGEYTRHAFSHS